ncbi:MAG: signal peptidase II [Alphaproteobacteria bacterium]
MILGLILAAVVIVLDQLSKFYVFNYVLADTNYIMYTPFFNLIKAWNTGVSFSIFSDSGIYGVIGLSVFAIFVIVCLLIWLYREQVKINKVALGLIIGGAIGNVIDRIRFGAVFDFLDFYVGDYHWPAFNVADSAIFIGAVLLIVQSTFAIKPKNS